ncbi:MAG TPA: PQQ-dependent sugar dehydrogenase [Anaeromyxobacter sp.]|nr:PQQ-dependent sugar dehydrogenase [Anaeromyxobacter sp.]
MPGARSRITAALAAGAFLVSVGCGVGDVPEQGEATAAAVPTGFIDELVASGIPSPTAMAFAPDGRLFVAQQNGQLRVITSGSPRQLLPTPFLTVTVSSVGERGLLGVAFDPGFATNRYVYVYYTATTPTIHNRVSRFTASATNPDVAQAGSETILLELNTLSSATNHNGGAMHFGPDGKLYIAVGENANRANAQTLENLLGKMLRINADGTIPADNPFVAQASGVNDAIWAIGLRNPFTFAFQPGTGRMFINDVGEVTWEEINDGIAGSNYGWPTTEGPTTQAGIRAPLFAYQHGSGATTGCAITGGAFYDPATMQFPGTYAGKYFFADYCSNWIRVFDPAAETAAGFATGLAAPVDLKVTDDGALWYLQRGGSPAGQVRRVRYGQQAEAPAITQHPASVTVAAGQQATFTVSATGTPPLSYQWQRGTTNIAGATSPTLSFTATSADNGATFRVVVTNAAGTAISNAATLTVGGSAPTASITTPAAGATYAAGTTVSFSGTGTDPQDGTLPASAFTWEVVFHHDTHTHPFYGPTSGITSGSVTIPNRGEVATNVFYRFRLTVRDSSGLTHTVTRDVVPRVANVTLQTNPAGLQLLLDGTPVTTPATIPNVVGVIRSIGAPSPQTSNGTQYTFGSWSDGGAATHEIVVPATATTYTATYTSGTGAGPIANGTYRLLPTHIPTTSSPRCVDVYGASTASGADVIQWTCHGGTNQRWQLTHQGSGVYELRPAHATTRCLAVQNGSASSGADVIQSTCSGTAGQRWLIRTVSTGVYELRPQSGTNLCLHVSGGSTANGADVIQSTCSGVSHQRFRIQP